MRGAVPDDAASNARPRWPGASVPGPDHRLIGRSTELAELGRLVADPATPLISLVGIGGVGKSRLAAALAMDALPRFRGRVAFVPLDGVTDPSLVLPAVAGALGVADAPGRPVLDGLAAELGRRPALLILDTIEHLRPGTPVLAELASRTTNLTIVGTSRVALGVPNEWIVRVEPLPVPAPADAPDAARETPSVTLFLDRARATRPDLEPTPATVTVIAEICRRLDGIPLAIELAAAALRVLAPYQLLDQLTDRIAEADRTPGGDDATPARQRSLRAAMDWSVELLGDEARRLLPRLAVFAGSFDTDAVRSLLEGATRRGLVPLQAPIEDLLAELAAASLLRRAAGVPGAWELLSTVRADALDRLHRSGEAVAMRWAHAYLFLELAEAAERDLPSDRELDALDRLEAAHDDIREAFDWAEARGDGTFAVRLAGALPEFWRTRGHLTEGRLRLATALAAGMDAPPRARRRALAGAGLLASSQGDYQLGESYLREALAVARASDDREGQAIALTWTGTNAYGAGRLTDAEAAIAEGLAMRRELGDEPGIAVSLNALGGVAHFRGDLDRAREMFAESLEIKGRLGNDNAIAVALTNLGLVERDAGNPDEALAAFRRAIAIWERSGDRQRLGVGLHNAALVALDGGALDEAVALLERAHASARDLGDRTGMAYTRADLARVHVERCDPSAALAAVAEALPRAVSLGSRVIVPLALEAAGNLAGSLGEDVAAARLWGAAAADRASSGFANMPADARPLERHQAAVRARMGDAAWSAAFAEGAAMASADVVETALGLRLPAARGGQGTRARRGRAGTDAPAV